MSVTSDAAAEEGTPTYVTRFDGVRVPATDYQPVWVTNLADDVTIEGSAMNGVVQGAEAVRSIVIYIRSLYDNQEFNFAGPYGENGFLEDYTAWVRGEQLGNVVLVTRNAAGQAQHVVASYRPRTTLLLVSRLVGEHFAGTRTASTSPPALPSDSRYKQEEHVAGGVVPFEVHIPRHELDDLRERLARTRWLDEFPGSGWSYGTSRRYLEELCEYWRAEFDWRACEARLNAFGQLAMDLDGQRVHAIHARSPEPGALPLLLVHGWPGSVFEFEKVIEPLRDPRQHGGDPADAFHVVCPSIPGYGFSGPTVGPGWNVRRISAAFALLMQRLGYDRYGAAGGDWGAIITSDLLRSGAGTGVRGLYLTMPLGEPPEESDDPEAGLRTSERQGLRDWTTHQAAGTVIHLPLNTTRPHTMAFAMNDSPAGLAAWLVDMYRSFSDCDGDIERCFTKDELLANVTTYWVTKTIASAARLYAEWAEQKRTSARPPRVDVPTGCAIYPRDVRRVPRSWAERLYFITHWTEMPAGGHFPALEQPELFVADLRAFFRHLRAQQR
jgi:pimeloyl-ACP methyl ester carboxylesterase